jgi:hypothetical protein
MSNEWIIGHSKLTRRQRPESLQGELPQLNDFSSTADFLGPFEEDCHLASGHGLYCLAEMSHVVKKWSADYGKYNTQEISKYKSIREMGCVEARNSLQPRNGDEVVQIVFCQFCLQLFHDRHQILLLITILTKENADNVSVVHLASLGP